MSDNRVLGIIPARGGSKGIPRKNIVPLGGKPLIGWTIEAALGARLIHRLIVSTDDEEIAAIARDMGADVPFLRPVDLSNDTAPALPVIKHAIDRMEADTVWSATAAVYLQPTSPFRSAADIDAVIALGQRLEADTVVSVVRVPHNMTPTALMEERDGWLQFVASPEKRSFRRQAKPTLLARNGPAILYVKRAVIDTGELYGSRIASYEMSSLASLDIDEPQDLLVAEALLPLVRTSRAAAGAGGGGDT